MVLECGAESFVAVGIAIVVVTVRSWIAIVIIASPIDIRIVGVVGF